MRIEVMPEKAIVAIMDEMCTESLHPEAGDMWDEVKETLEHNRQQLKNPPPIEFEIKNQYGKVDFSEQHELLTLEDGMLFKQRIMYGVGETIKLRNFLNQLDLEKYL